MDSRLTGRRSRPSCTITTRAASRSGWSSPKSFLRPRPWRRSRSDSVAASLIADECLEALNPDLVLTLRVVGAANAAAGIRQFELVDADGGELPEFTAGAHVLVQAPSGVTRRYSLCNPPE